MPETEKQLERERYRLLHRIESLMEGPMAFLGFVWLVLLVVELIWGISQVLQYVSYSIWIIFIIDFIIKLILAPKKIKFFKTNWLTAISLAIPALRIVRFLRFATLLRGLRGVRLIRVVSSVNRSMSSLNSTMQRRGFKYVIILTIGVCFAGAAGMYALERDVSTGFRNYGHALWWTAMILITMGTDYWPQTPEGRALNLLLSLYGFTMLGYITATLASFFVGRDAEEKNAPVAGSKDVSELKREIEKLSKSIQALHEKNNVT